jgi:tRNA(Ile)-lysidine synthase
MTPEEPVIEAIRCAIAELPVGEQVVVAFSGGVDSTALLHACAQVVSPERVQACHVHHGLQPAADAFARHCADTASQLGVRFALRHLTGKPARGESIEAWAREHRYEALSTFARELNAAAVLTAHHVDDQAETLLIAMARGSGLDGLSGIHADSDRGGIRVLRPLLGLSRQQLADHCARHALQAVYDPMNDDLALLRSALRAKVMPVLYEVVPGFAAHAARSAGLIAEAAQLAYEVAQADLAQAQEKRGVLHAAAIAHLSRARQANALRQWLRESGAPMPSQARLRALLTQAFESQSTHALWRHAGWSVVRYRDRLQVVSPQSPVRPDLAAPQPVLLRWAGESCWRLTEWGLAIRIGPAAGAEADAFLIDREALLQGPMEVCAAGARTRVRPAPRASSREVRKRWQELGIAPWLRAWLPEVRVAGQALGVVALGAAAMGPGKRIESVALQPAGADRKPSPDADHEQMALSVQLLSAEDPRSGWVLPYN